MQILVPVNYCTASVLYLDTPYCYSWQSRLFTFDLRLNWVYPWISFTVL